MHSPRIKDFSVLESYANCETFLEKRMEYDGVNNLIYVGYTKNPNESVDSDTYFIVKLEYDASNNLTRYRLPNTGATFSYVWDDRATYFA